MKKHFFFILALAASCLTLFAQNNPVQFSFSTQRKNDSLVYLVVHAKQDKNFLLFSAKPQSRDDAFISQLTLDSASSKYRVDTIIIESSNVQIVKDESTSTSFKAFADSATFFYPLKIEKDDSAEIRGSFSWLGKMGDEFPSGEQKFELDVLPEHSSPADTIVSEPPPHGWLSFFWIGLVAGLFAVFLPC